MGVDWRLLQNQKMAVLEITYGDHDILLGLVNFIEALQDAAIDEGIATSEEVFDWLPESAIPTLEETVERMKAEIREDMRAGRISNNPAGFADLHDFVDANEYGGFCEDELADRLITHFGGHSGQELVPQGMLDYINAAQEAIDKWLKDR
jgi:hypothetical protein